MGKKSRNSSKVAAKAAAARPAATSMTVRTTSASLQAKLDQLSALANAGDVEACVRAFVPLDLSADDLAYYLGDLTTGPEAEGAWRNLSSEIGAIAASRGVWKIEGDQTESAVFFFPHPLLHGCDREVEFRCVGGEWRAAG